MLSPAEDNENNMCAKVCFIEWAGDGFRWTDSHGLHFDSASVMRGAASFVRWRRLSRAMHVAGAARDCRMGE